jgi:hypothetical protein
MEQKAQSPRIKHLSWGRLDVEGQDHPYKDAKLFPGGSREWDWRETGTDHTHGIQPADVAELLERGTTVVVLSKGFQNRLQVCRETIEMLNDKSIPVHILQTEQAVRLYNELRDQENVGALSHSTC